MTSKRTIPARRFIKPTFDFLIEKKRDGGEFTQEEIRYIIDSTLDGEMPSTSWRRCHGDLLPTCPRRRRRS
jgi:hypothetical protein